MNYEENLLFTKDHVWMKKLHGNFFQLGITNFAQDLLGDIVFVEMHLNREVAGGESLGSIESVKTASEIICPNSCKVQSVNEEILKTPELINDAPYETWICEVEFITEIKSENFLTHKMYQESIK